MNKLISTFALLAIIAVFTVGCGKSENQTNAQETEEAENETEESVTESPSDANYFRFMSDLNIGFTPDDIAKILPQNAVKTDKSDKASKSSNFIYTVKGEDIEGFIEFRKWDYQEYIWSFECSLDVALNWDRGKEIYEELVARLIKEFGEPESTDNKSYAMWNAEIMAEPASVRVAFADAGIEYEITLVTY